jgi:hypothetical protein
MQTAIINILSDTPTMTPKIHLIEASASLYSFEVRKLEGAIDAGRKYAKKINERFNGMSIDIDSEGNVFVHIAGVDTVKL